MTLTTHPDGLFDVLRTLSVHGRPALTYAEIASELDITDKTVAKWARIAVDHEWATLDKAGRAFRITITDAGAAALAERATLPTTAAVVAEARRIVRDAQSRMANNPFARPYVPSDDVARKLAAQLGAAEAIRTLRFREAEHRSREDEQDAISARAERRRERNARAARADEQARRAELTPGQRLDRALSLLRRGMVVPAARIDGDPISDGGGGKDDTNPVPKLHDQTMAWAQRRVDQTVTALEDAAAGQLRRLFDFEWQGPRPVVVEPVDPGAEETRLDRLVLRHRGEDPELAASSAPDLGTPGDVRARRRRLGLREIDGREPLSDAEAESLRTSLLFEGCTVEQLAQALDWSLGRAHAEISRHRVVAPLYGTRQESAA